MIHTAILHLAGRYGYAALALGVAAESLGLPVPGELMLLAAAGYAGATGRMALPAVILAAFAGAAAGGAGGYWVGRALGTRLPGRFGPLVGITPRRVMLGRHLLARHGGKVVLLGRFVAVLRALTPVLAGAGLMPWPRFLAFNLAGSAAWAVAVGLGTFLLGRHAGSVSWPVRVLALLGAAAVLLGGVLALRRAEARLARGMDRRAAGLAPACLPPPAPAPPRGRG